MLKSLSRDGDGKSLTLNVNDLENINSSQTITLQDRLNMYKNKPLPPDPPVEREECHRNITPGLINNDPWSFAPASSISLYSKSPSRRTEFSTPTSGVEHDTPQTRSSLMFDLPSPKRLDHQQQRHEKQLPSPFFAPYNVTARAVLEPMARRTISLEDAQRARFSPDAKHLLPEELREGMHRQDWTEAQASGRVMDPEVLLDDAFIRCDDVMEEGNAALSRNMSMSDEDVSCLSGADGEVLLGTCSGCYQLVQKRSYDCQPASAVGLGIERGEMTPAPLFWRLTHRCNRQRHKHPYLTPEFSSSIIAARSQASERTHMQQGSLASRRRRSTSGTIKISASVEMLSEIARYAHRVDDVPNKESVDLHDCPISSYDAQQTVRRDSSERDSCMHRPWNHDEECEGRPCRKKKPCRSTPFALKSPERSLRRARCNEIQDGWILTPSAKVMARTQQVAGEWKRSSLDVARRLFTGARPSSQEKAAERRRQHLKNSIRVILPNVERGKIVHHGKNGMRSGRGARGSILGDFSGTFRS